MDEDCGRGGLQSKGVPPQNDPGDVNATIEHGKTEVNLDLEIFSNPDSDL
jgi:hypothetical protein